MRQVTVRPENAHQTELLRLLRDEGPISRAELGEAVHLSRSKLAVELDRLTEIGLVDSRGLAASRGGRRSAITTSVSFCLMCTSSGVAMKIEE